MDVNPVSNMPYSFTRFGDLLKYLRRRAHLTQLELSIAVGYSEAQISRLEKNQRLPDLSAIQALFIPALHLENEPQLIAHFLELAQSARQEDAPAPGFAPYKGLLFFDESDADLFFGREALTEQLVRHVMDIARDASTRFLAVVGASGSGKSSLVRAGLAVALKHAGWETCVLTPTASPLKTLQANLHPEQMNRTERMLFVVDQFEEVFTLCRDEMERIAFIENLLTYAQDESKKITVVIALRADFYSHCAQYPLLRSVIASQQEYIGQMTTEALRRAIEEPARRGGWEFEPGLVDVLLQDIGVQGSHVPEPGALPLLSHALLATWERRRGCLFTLHDYYSAGGVRGAIAETAESVFADQLNQAQQELAQHIFLRLTELGEGTEDTRRRASLNELTRRPDEAAQLRAVLNILAEARLVTLDEDYAEVAHEALIREWKRLHEWLTQDREGLILHRRLSESAREWQALRQDPAELYRGARLASTREWAARNEEKLNTAERAFLAASIEQEQRVALEREVQRQRELEAAQNLVATQKRRVEEQTRAAHQMRQSTLFLAGALIMALILLLSTFSFSNQSDLNAEDALNAQATAVMYADNTANLINVAFGKELLPLSGQTVSTSLTAHGPNGKLITASVDYKDIIIRDAHSGAQLLKLTGHTDYVTHIAFSPDGTQLASSSHDKTVILWDLTSGKALFILKGHTDWILSVAFSADGKRLATGSDDTTAIVWDTTTGKALFTFKGHSRSIENVAFSQNGKQLATTSVDSTVITWDLTTGDRLLTLSGYPYAALSVAYNTDSTRIMTGHQDGTVNIWDASTGQLLMTLKGHPGVITAIACSPDGKWLVAVFNDGTARIWNLVTGNILYDFSRPFFDRNTQGSTAIE